MFAEPTLPEGEQGAGPDASHAVVDEHEVYFQGEWLATKIYDRSLLVPGNRIDGPAIVTEFDSTTVVLAESFVLHQRRDVELLPDSAVGVGVLRAHPGLDARARPRLEVFGITQAERAFDEQRGARAEALGDEQQPRLLRDGDRLRADKRRKIGDAVEIAAHVGDAPEPGLRQRHRRNRRDRYDLARLHEIHQPCLAAHPQTELGRCAHAGLRALQPFRKRELVVAQRDAGGGGRHQPSAAIFARRSA